MRSRLPTEFRYASWGETRISEVDLERLLGSVTGSLSAGLSSCAYYFVPLTIADTGEVMIAPLILSTAATRHLPSQPLQTRGDSLTVWSRGADSIAFIRIAKKG